MPSYEIRSEALGFLVGTSKNITDLKSTNLLPMEARTVYCVGRCWSLNDPWYSVMTWGNNESEIRFQTGVENTMSIRVDTINGKRNQTLVVPGKNTDVFVTWAACTSGLNRVYGGINHNIERYIKIIPGDGFAEQLQFKLLGNSVITGINTLAFSGFHNINTRTKIISNLLAQYY